MDWFDVTEKYHEMTFNQEGDLLSLPEEWQRELAAIWRLEADVNNGAYLQFLTNWGRESYTYASQALKKIGARKMAEIIDRCQALVDEHFDMDDASPEQIDMLMPGTSIGRFPKTSSDDHDDDNVVKKTGSILPQSVIDRIYDLSYQFMDYPDDLAALGVEYYQRFVESDDSTGP